MDKIEQLNDTIESLRIKIDKLEDENSRLREELRTAESLLRSAKFRITEELEPRIREGKKAYDTWVSSPNRMGGDE